MFLNVSLGTNDEEWNFWIDRSSGDINPSETLWWYNQSVINKFNRDIYRIVYRDDIENKRFLVGWSTANRKFQTRQYPNNHTKQDACMATLCEGSGYRVIDTVVSTTPVWAACVVLQTTEGIDEHSWILWWFPDIQCKPSFHNQPI